MNLVNEIKEIEGVEVHHNKSLSKFTTIRLEVVGSIAIVQTLGALQSLIKLLLDKGIHYHLVGWGANQILINTENTLFIKLNFDFDRNYLKQVHDEYRFPASVSLNVLTSHAQKFGLKGWEVFTGIPASLGGAIFMNAGTGLGEIGDLVKEVTVLRKNGMIEVLTGEAIKFSYRKNYFVNDGDIIIEAVLIHNGVDEKISQKIKEYLEFRKNSQPITTKNCGCVFKNFDTQHRAGHFIELIGLKGLGINGLNVSLKHANFIENSESANGEDFSKLTQIMIDELELQTGIKFELEAKIY